MKLHASGPAAYNAITAYGEGYVAINGERHNSGLIVMADRILPWNAVEFETLTAENFKILADLNAEIILLGTGARQRFPHPRLTAALTEAGIGLEVMDLKAACRTYNILVAEERKVAAALMFR